jgi:hypothetical protein
MKVLSGISVLALLLAGATAPSFATALAPGGTVVPGAPTPGGFTTLADTGVQNYSYGNGVDTGTYESLVGTFTGNPFGANDMTFLYQVTVTGGDIQHISGFNFGTGQWLIDVAQTSFSPFGGTVAAATADFDFGVVEFDFPGPNGALVPGDTSLLLIINTNAPTWTAGTIGLLDGGGTTEPGFMPAATPEPSTLSLLGTGLLAAGAGLRRKMRRA